jgi:hypothetical protein
MNNKFQTIKIWKKTLKALYFIRAYTSESIVALLDRLVKKELKEVSTDKTLKKEK